MSKQHPKSQTLPPAMPPSQRCPQGLSFPPSNEPSPISFQFDFFEISRNLSSQSQRVFSFCTQPFPLTPPYLDLNPRTLLFRNAYTGHPSLRPSLPPPSPISPPPPLSSPHIAL
ncbi:hypothetical protein N7G274_007269 [Stereocaulon virgatum]|uniref:Uncharacterized protein n=1 Tax=Stereocaulon virgatum TaxID=373712 RepID=A0ABR4A2I8_9LECA